MVSKANTITYNTEGHAITIRCDIVERYEQLKGIPVDEDLIDIHLTAIIERYGDRFDDDQLSVMINKNIKESISGYIEAE